MKEVTFQMAIGTNSGEFMRSEECTGVHAFDLFGFEWVAHKSVEYDAEDYEYTIWEMSEVTSGRKLPGLKAPTFEKIVTKGRDYLEKLGEETVKEGINRAKESNKSTAQTG